MKSDWDAWNARSLADEPIVQLILDDTWVRVRLDRKATAIALLVALGEVGARSVPVQLGVFSQYCLWIGGPDMILVPTDYI